MNADILWATAAGIAILLAVITTIITLGSNSHNRYPSPFDNQD